jgi:hypothetical protein
MDWLLVGDLRGMVRERWRQYGVDPDMPLPALAHRDTRVERSAISSTQQVQRAA